MLFSKLSVHVVCFAVLATGTLARSPGRHARRFFQDEIAQPTPVITPTPILPAAKLKARDESTGKTETFETDTRELLRPVFTTIFADPAAQTTTTALLAADADAPTPKSTGTGNPDLDFEDDPLENDNETTTVKYTYTSPRTTTSLTKFIYDDDDDTTMGYTTTVQNTSTHATTTITTTSSGHKFTPTSIMDDDMDYMDETTTSTVKMTSSRSTSTKSTAYWTDDESEYTHTSTYSSHYYKSTSLYPPTWTTPTSKWDDSHPYKTRTSVYDEPMYTTEPSGSPTTNTDSLSPTNIIDLKKFRAIFGDSNAASIDCKSLPEGTMQGVAVKDLVNILKQPDGNVYNIDRSGCFQAKCIGDYGVLRLCNIKPVTGVMSFRAAEVKALLSFLLQAIRPNWEAELSFNFNNLIYQPDAITFCGTSYNAPQQPMPKPGSPFLHGIKKAATKQTKDALTYSPHIEKINMPLSFQPRFPNYWDENLGVPVNREARFNGIISNAEKGWAVVIDSVSKEDLKCSSGNNFKTTCGTADAKDPEKCVWDNTVPKPYFTPGDDMSQDKT
ncbi:hypothetical protein AOL_s00215g772 [Orbilia oligospora ATCC 24927]|uniref:Uncharacterized protein n=1 Tax=Arthrobotrys oligospora (strain ATCC 24927 / CBS 115.81 / DSM 1491) TaxID=756982 RepID=G1XUW4_ARTOA|nr:hypothetical protein AOL_s00215g772 [Orbilia oligospora ATCC 24927]EGX42986.1 hypothetical protein AOL_s00215g772 [Orbilia oligospora ATCC 24927]